MKTGERIWSIYSQEKASRVTGFGGGLIYLTSSGFSEDPAIRARSSSGKDDITNSYRTGAEERRACACRRCFVKCLYSITRTTTSCIAWKLRPEDRVAEASGRASTRRRRSTRTVGSPSCPGTASLTVLNRPGTTRSQSTNSANGASRRWRSRTASSSSAPPSTCSVLGPARGKAVAGFAESSQRHSAQYRAVRVRSRSPGISTFGHADGLRENPANT